MEMTKKPIQAKEKGKKRAIVKSLLAYLKGSWGQVFLAWVFVGIEVVCEVLVPWMAGSFIVPGIKEISHLQQLNQPIDSVVGSLWMYGGIMLCLAIVSATGGVLAGFFAAAASAKFGRNLRAAMYRKIQEFSFSNIDKFSTSSLITRLTTDVANIQNAVQTILRMVVRAPMLILFALAMSITISWQLALIFLGVIPFLSLVLFGVAIIVHPTFVRVFNAYDDLNESVQENLKGIRVVKSFGREQFETERFGKVSYYIYRMFLHAERLIALNNPAMQISIYTCKLLIAYLGAKIIVSSGGAGSFDEGSLTSLFAYAMQILMALNFVSMGFVMIIIARNSAERVSEVLSETSDLVSPENAIAEVPNGSVDFNHVTFRYNSTSERPVLDDVDIHIPSGSTVGIIGGTGSSKTTFISMIARLYDVSQGEVMVGGHNVKDYDLQVLRDSVAVVLQKNVLFTGTIRSNLLWGKADATQEEIEHAAHLACADEFIEKFPLKYDSPIEEGGSNVSGGQKQRLCIARALLKSPKILILDDSTSAVDTHTDAMIRHAFQTEIPDVTKFIVAQRILSIKDCDMILVLDSGRLIAAGTNDELMESCSLYREIYETQLGGGDFDAAN